MDKVGESDSGLEMVACMGPINMDLVELDMLRRYAPPGATHWDYRRDERGDVEILSNMLGAPYPLFVRVCFYTKRV